MISRVKKTFRYSGLMSSVQLRKTKTQQNGKKMLVWQGVSLTFPDTKVFIGKKLKQKSANENNENVAAKDEMDHSNPWLSSSFRCLAHCEFSSVKAVVRRSSIK